MCMFRMCMYIYVYTHNMDASSSWAQAVSLSGPFLMAPGHNRPGATAWLQLQVQIISVTHTMLAKVVLAPQWPTLYYRKDIDELEKFQYRSLRCCRQEYMPCEERLEELGSASLEQRQLCRDLTAAHCAMKRPQRRQYQALHRCAGHERDSRHKLKRRRLRMDVRISPLH